MTRLFRLSLEKSHELDRHGLSMNGNAVTFVRANLASKTDDRFDFRRVHLIRQFYGCIELDDVVIFLQSRFEYRVLGDHSSFFISLEFAKYLELIGLTYFNFLKKLYFQLIQKLGP